MLDGMVDQFDRKCFPSVILRESVGANATKGESKDPENTSSAMPCQGILPELLPSFLHGKTN